MRHKVSELEGALLDAAVAKIVDLPRHPQPDGSVLYRVNGELLAAEHWRPSSNWEHGGPIIESERITVQPMDFAGRQDWQASTDRFLQTLQNGPTPLVAAMRAYVTSKFGEVVELP